MKRDKTSSRLQDARKLFDSIDVNNDKVGAGEDMYIPNVIGGKPVF